MRSNGNPNSLAFHRCVYRRSPSGVCLMKVVYVAGAYHAKTIHMVLKNIRAAEGVAMQVWEAGFVAFCPHLNSAFFDGLVDDSVFLAGTLEMLSRCDGLILVPGWGSSKGTLAEVRYCVDNGIPVFTTVEDLLNWQCSWNAGMMTNIPAVSKIDSPTESRFASPTDTCDDAPCGCALCVTTELC